jgi:hypothetical protein
MTKFFSIMCVISSLYGTMCLVTHHKIDAIIMFQFATLCFLITEADND